MKLLEVLSPDVLSALATVLLPLLGALVHRLSTRLPPEVQQAVNILLEHQAQQQRQQGQSLLQAVLEGNRMTLSKPS
jgi:hypothetical protein